MTRATGLTGVGAKVLAAAALAAALSVACAPAGTGGSDEAPRAIASVHRARCGSCHERVEPGQRTRAQLDEALARHHRRVRLSDEEWARMIDYLATPTTTGATAQR